MTRKSAPEGAGRTMTMTPTLGCALALLLCALAGPSLAAPNP